MIINENIKNHKLYKNKGKKKKKIHEKNPSTIVCISKSNQKLSVRLGRDLIV